MSTTTQAPINVLQHPVLGPAVSARAVYTTTTVSKASRDVFSDWFRDKQRKLDLIENKDFITTAIPVAGSSRKHIEHIVTISAAQRIAEIAPAQRGTELAAYLKYYSSNEAMELTAEVEAIRPIPSLSLFNSAPTVDIPPVPASVSTTSLSPVQQLLAEVQKLAEQEASRSSDTQVQPEQVKALEGRLNRLEKQVSTILYFFQQASTALRALPPAQLPYDAGLSSAPLPDLEPTTRVKITRLVDGYAAAKTVAHQEVWRHLYGHLNSRHGFDAWQHANGKKNPNYLDIAEENGQLENLYSLAVELLALSQR